MNRVNISSIVNGIIVNEGGITLTLDKNKVLDKKIYKSGYQVSVEDVFILDVGHRLDTREWDELFKHLEVQSHEHHHQPAIGAWFNEETDKIHWDISINVQNPRAAYFIAKEKNQLEIFNWKQRCSHDLDSFTNLINKDVL